MELEEFFNKAQIKTMATINDDGTVNLCPCGTAMMRDGKITIGCVGIARSRENIIKTEKATFMAHNPVNKECWKQYERGGVLPDPAGYRLYCTFIKETQEDEVLKEIREKLLERTGEKVAGRLSSAMIFDVDEERAVRL